MAVAALAASGVAAATGAANAAQGGLTTERSGGDTSAQTKASPAKSAPAKAKASGQGGVASETNKAPAAAKTKAAPAKAAQSSPTTGGQAGVQTEKPAPTISQAESNDTGASDTKPESSQSTADENDSKPAPASTPTRSATPSQEESAPQAPAATQTTGNTSARAATTTTAQVAPVVNSKPLSSTTGQGGVTTETATPQQQAPSTSGAAATGAGQAGVATEYADISNSTPAVEGEAQFEVQAPAAQGSTDYSERVEAASQTPTSGSFAPATPAEPSGQPTAYSEVRDNGGEAGYVGNTVATGTAVEVSDTTSYVSNTTTGGGDQATAAQTWDASNGNYNATWATTGGVSGAGGFSATNEQTSPNVGTAGVDGQWSSTDGASSVSITGGASLQNYGVHDASGSVSVQTPVGDFAFSF